MKSSPSDDSAVLDADAPNEHVRWVNEIALYENEAKRWEDKSKKILRRYKDDRNSTEERRTRYNILWSNVQTLHPALYASNPKADIERRHKQKDNLGRVTAQVLERTTTYFVDNEQFGRAMSEAVLDRLLPGRGVVWARYEPHFRDASIQGNEEVQGEGAQLTDDIYPEQEDEEALKEVYYEEVCFDYVHWQDFGHTIARTVAEVRALWRKVYLSREELTERFGKEKANAIPLDYSPRGLNDEKIPDDQKKATIYEIWNEPNETVYWLHKDYPKILDKREDYLGLWDFYPCPMPLLATTANDSIIPVPDFVEYQDQALELDELTARIASITKALKVVGVYAAEAEGVQRILSEGIENTLVPVEQWTLFAEKGGLKGIIEYLPVQEIAQTLLFIYEARDKVLQDIYQITGISDIVRGQTNPNETATAQQIKGQFATLRLRSMQDDVQRFARDLVRIAAQIIAKHFSMDTIKKICGVQLLTMQEKQKIQQQQQMQAQQAQQQAQMSGQPPAPPPPLSEEMQEMMANPTWEEVEQLLRDDAMLGFRIDIETNSTIKQDEEAEKQSRVELLTAVSSFMQQAQVIQDPTLKILMAELLGFGVRGFKAGKQVEGAVQLAIDKIEKQAQTPAPPPPNPETIKAESQMKIEQMKMQGQQQQAQQQAELDMQKEQMKQQIMQQQNALESHRTAEDREMQAQLERERMQNDFLVKQYEIDSKIALDHEIALLEHKTKAREAENKDNNDKQDKADNSEMKAAISAITSHMEALNKHITSPRKAIRNADGSYELRVGE